MKKMKRICVFCGSNVGNKASYTATARELGIQLLRRELSLVYGGGRVGIMGAVSEVVHEGGGQVIGVIPKALTAREVAYDDIGDMRVVDSMHERKAMMADLSDAFVALPGGLGTLEELFEVWTWGQLGYHQKPVGLLNIDGYYDPLLGFIEHAVDEGFVKPEHRDMLVTAENIADLFEGLMTFEPPTLPQWIQHGEL